MVIKVYICEDNKIQLKKIKKIIDNIMLIENYDLGWGKVTDNPYEIINYLEKENSTGIYFLDVNLKSDINGFKLAEKIRQYDPRGFIIFITNHAEMSYLTFIYKVEALDYIIKDEYVDLDNRIKNCMDNCINKYKNLNNKSHKVFSFNIKDKIINIEYDKILFFETSKSTHKITLSCVDRQIDFYGTLKEIENLLDKSFFRCHTSFIVNKNNIKHIDKTNRIIKMIDGQECYISTRAMRKINREQKF